MYEISQKCTTVMTKYAKLPILAQSQNIFYVHKAYMMITVLNMNIIQLFISDISLHTKFMA